MKTFCLVLFAALVQLNHALPTGPSGHAAIIKDPFIMNGEDALEGEFPHQMMMEKKRGSQFSLACGAVIISKYQALTAAHCVQTPNIKDYRLIAGLHQVSNISDSQYVTLKKIVPHPRYNDKTASFANDIAVLTFTTPLTLTSKIQPIIWNHNENLTFAGDRCILSGWGRTTSGFPNTLQKVKLNIITNKKCAQEMKPVQGTKIYPGHICAHEPYFGSCNGDSGGPMTCQHNGASILVGVTSWGISNYFNCLPKYPSVYARTSHFVDFIQENII